MRVRQFLNLFVYFYDEKFNALNLSDKDFNRERLENSNVIRFLISQQYNGSPIIHIYTDYWYIFEIYVK
jgi:hypothetical protein